MSTPMVAPAPLCPACEDARFVIREIRHDGRDCVDKEGHYEQIRVPCPDCQQRRS